MPRIDCVKETAVVRSLRVRQMEGMFDVSPSDKSRVHWHFDLPIEGRDWSIGLIVGPSGCGKTTIAKHLFPDKIVGGFEWPADRSILDGFPDAMGIKDVTGLLSSVGFSSPPSWLRPFGALSNGEQFRVTIARALAEQPELAVIDEFTSVVDRTVAKISSAAVAKAVRRSGRRLVAVACHYDIVEWLDPDWLFDPSTGECQWRLERRRPPIQLTIQRVHRDAWKLFSHHHYLSRTISKAGKCFVGFVESQPAVFASVIHGVGRSSAFREHRTVCLPDFQGVGIGNAMSEYVASLFACVTDYFSLTSSPAMIRHRSKSPNWKTIRKTSFAAGKDLNMKSFSESRSGGKRYTASFKYVGLKRPDDASKFGLKEKVRP